MRGADSLYVLVLLIIRLTKAGICPQTNHTVCNRGILHHACVCSLAVKDEAPPEKSCNKLLRIENDRFPAVSIMFDMKEAADHYDTFPEDKFRTAIATSLHVIEEDILILRIRCVDDDKTLLVQFVILEEEASKKSTTRPTRRTTEVSKRHRITVKSRYRFHSRERMQKHDEITTTEEKRTTVKTTISTRRKPDDDYSEDDEVGYEDASLEIVAKKSEESELRDRMVYNVSHFLRAGDIVKRMKGITHIGQLTDLGVERIKLVERLTPIEGEVDNSSLIVEATLTGLAFLMMLLLGIYKAITHKDEGPPYESVTEKS
ncbi:hypothetical protein AB6A40_006715 [Gnathostoma spinigerum]|uniref:Uncharacterized protein n=1 Tax=Gnathostoma spinigerum TaxID=75299 RepID=A0ABD6ERD5_9BILA